MAAAWLEIVVGAIFLTAPDVPCLLLFGARQAGVGMPPARFAGIALVALGICCLPSRDTRPDRSAVMGLLVFNVEATIFFAWVGVATTQRGVLLWPVVILHAVIAVALLTIASKFGVLSG
jgi:hypothetical protein